MSTVKSQDDIKKPENRSSDVLIKTIERCQELEEENQKLKGGLKQSIRDEVVEQLLAHQALSIILLNMCKLELQKLDTENAKELCEKIDRFFEASLDIKELEK